MSRRPLSIHLIAIGGTGMAPLACLLQQLGHRVRGSDGPLYPPMSTVLRANGIEPMQGYDPAHLQPPPDLVVVGNAVPRDNPEAAEAERLGLPRISMPEALARFFLSDRKPLVVAGTHGKTTTTAMAAWVWHRCGAEPGYLIGGAPRDLEHNFAAGKGERFIVEGDEYNAAYFDRGAKFLHYRPQTLILTSVEYDHADLYPDHASLLRAYEALVSLVPADGLLAACGDAPALRDVAVRAGCPVRFYGVAADNDVRAEAIEEGAGGCRFRIADGGRPVAEIRLPLAGRHNVANALAVWTAARADGLPADAVGRALAEFRGVKRRLEELGEAGGVLVVDDFAHHPTAVAASLAALRARHPARRLVAVFEPRTLSAGRAIFAADYRRAFAGADRVVLAPVFHAERLGRERLDVETLAADLQEDGLDATAIGDAARLLDAVLDGLAPGDLVVTMSSGSFAGLPGRLLESLQVAAATVDAVR